MKAKRKARARTTGKSNYTRKDTKKKRIRIWPPPVTRWVDTDEVLIWERGER